ncbi:tRNA guanosine-2'-O-methyltransferase [Rozella allomycis CSF55]|uniref:tRNA (guanine(10)-N(2))-methyltransferase n=1 Tax=Rozella allomycis (strain CSF55) TaxID=988480 RepID=A0A4P9YI43_ROZAC|nr:tRNA guanosine-2'-O-methyltransferase [Rozella allomycis CSF55]
MGEKLYLVRFVQRHAEFRLAEFEALCKLFDIKYKAHTEYTDLSPFWIVSFRSEDDIRKILSRSFLIKCVLEHYACSEQSLDHLAELVNDIPQDVFEVYRNDTFKFVIDTFATSMSGKEKIDTIEKFAYLPFDGDIDLKNPKNTFHVIIDNRHTIEKEPRAFYFGRWIGDGNREFIDIYNVKKRKYIGTTTMDAELSLIMSNMALVKKGSLVYDPFVGTVTSSCFGSYSFGSDIDGRQIRGKDGSMFNDSHLIEKSLKSNIAQYKLQNRVLGTVVCDITQHPFRPDGFRFDAIITDPPYGVRAGAKKIMMKEGGFFKNTEDGKSFYPATIPYELPDVIYDLLNFSSVYLEIGGRLVYWLPVIDDEEENDLKEPPNHPCFDMISKCPQIFGGWRRILVTMEKKCDPESIDSNIKKDHLVEPFRNRFFTKMKLNSEA